MFGYFVIFYSYIGSALARIPYDSVTILHTERSHDVQELSRKLSNVIENEAIPSNISLYHLDQIIANMRDVIKNLPNGYEDGTNRIGITTCFYSDKSFL